MKLLTLIVFPVVIINCSQNTMVSSSYISGMYYDVEKVDTLIYCTTGRGLEIFSFKKGQLKLVSRYATDGVARACDISDQYAIIADDYKGICILDISNPENPKKIGSYNSGGQARDVLVQGEYLYLADYDKGLLIFDISKVTSPKFIGAYEDIAGACWIRIKDTLAYVGDLGAPFKIINIANPTKPQIVNEFPEGSFDYGDDICIDDTLAYVNCRIQTSDAIFTFAVINIKNPAHPRFVSGITLPSTRQGLIKRGNFIYTNTFNEGVFIIDVTLPSAPIISGQYKISNYSGNRIEIDDNLLIVPHFVDGFSIAQINDPKKPKTIYHKQNIRWEFLTIDDNLGYLYLLGNVEDMDLVRSCYLKIFDINDPEKLRFCAELAFSGRGSLSDGSYDYPYLLMTNQRGHPKCDTLYTEIVDLRNPYKPRVVKSIKGGGIIEFHSPNIYALDCKNVRKGNINDPHIWTGNISLPERGNDFAVRDTFVYIITKDSLITMNVNSGDQTGSCSHNRSLATNISLDYPYLAATYTLCDSRHTYGFLLFDVTDIKRPALVVDTVIYGDTISHNVRSLIRIMYSMSCELRDSLLYFGRGIYGFDVWQIGKQNTLVKLFTVDTPYIATHCFPHGNGNLRVYKDHVFLIDYIVGLEIYKVGNLLSKKGY